MAARSFRRVAWREAPPRGHEPAPTSDRAGPSAKRAMVPSLTLEDTQHWFG